MHPASFFALVAAATALPSALGPPPPPPPQGAQHDAPAILGDWSASISGTQWDLHFDPSRRYSILRVGAAGDTLVLSMGTWSLEGQFLCIVPPGREPICGQLRIQNANDRPRTEWAFREPISGFGWLAYRRGYAPWDRWTPARETDVYDLTDVAQSPQFLGCSEPLVLPDGITGPIRIYARLVVETDSTVSHIEIANAPNAEVEARARAIAASCRLAPGRLEGGTLVRVRVEFPIEFPD